MSNDLFKVVNESAGQEVKASDLTNISKFLLAQIYDRILAGIGPSFNDPEEQDIVGTIGADMAQTPYAYALTATGAYLRQGSANNKIQVAPGTLLQKIGATTGSDIKLLPYTFDGTGDQWSIANEVTGNPRVDLLQMALSLETGDTQSRVYEVDNAPAFIDMFSHTTHFTSVYQAKARGKGGNNIQIRTVSGGAAAYAEAGNQITLTFQAGVTHDTDMDALVAANSTLIEVSVAGGGGLLADPADVFGYVNLSGGLDSVLVSQNVNMQYRVKATFTVKQGAAAASPAYPDPDPGCVVVGAVVVGANYAAAGGILYEDTAGAVAVIHDQRMPIGVKRHMTFPGNMTYDSAMFSEGSSAPILVVTVAGSHDVYIPCLSPAGRLIGGRNGIYGAGAAVSGNFIKKQIYGPVFLTSNTNLNDVYANGTGSADFSNRPVSLANLQANHTPAAGPTVVANANGMGAPVWTNGKRAFCVDQPAFPQPWTCLELKLTCAQNVALGPFTFFVAEGL